MGSYAQPVNGQEPQRLPFFIYFLQHVFFFFLSFISSGRTVGIRFSEILAGVFCTYQMYSRLSPRAIPQLGYSHLCDMARSVTPTLETNRLLLVPLQMKHIDNLADLDSDPEVLRYITDGETRDRKHQEEAVPRVLNYMQENPGLGLWIAYLKETNEFIGWYILKHLPDDGEVEVGFRLKKEFWSKGYSTEAGKALVNHGFESLGLKRIAAIVRPDNLASQAVIKNIGLKEEGTGTFYGIHCLYFGLEKP